MKLNFFCKIKIKHILQIACCVSTHFWQIWLYNQLKKGFRGPQNQSQAIKEWSDGRLLFRLSNVQTSFYQYCQKLWNSFDWSGFDQFSGFDDAAQIGFNKILFFSLICSAYLSNYQTINLELFDYVTKLIISKIFYLSVTKTQSRIETNYYWRCLFNSLLPNSLGFELTEWPQTAIKTNVIEKTRDAILRWKSNQNYFYFLSVS